MRPATPRPTPQTDSPQNVPKAAPQTEAGRLPSHPIRTKPKLESALVVFRLVRPWPSRATTCRAAWPLAYQSASSPTVSPLTVLGRRLLFEVDSLGPLLVLPAPLSAKKTMLQIPNWRGRLHLDLSGAGCAHCRRNPCLERLFASDFHATARPATSNRRCLSPLKFLISPATSACDSHCQPVDSYARWPRKLWCRLHNSHVLCIMKRRREFSSIWNIACMTLCTRGHAMRIHY